MDLSMPPVPPRPPPPPLAGSPPAAASPQQSGPPPSPATSPRPLVLGGGGTAALATAEGARAARTLAEELQAGLMPLLDPRGQPAAQGVPGLERPYARDECVHVFRVRSRRTGRARSFVAWLRHTKNVQQNLLMAIRCNDPNRVRLMVGMGADVNKMDFATRQTPLQLAETIGSNEAAAVLTELGALRAPQPPPAPEVAPPRPSRHADLLQMLLDDQRMKRCPIHRQEAAGREREGAGPQREEEGWRGRVMRWNLLEELRAEPRDQLRVNRRLMQARELLRNVRRRRVNSEMGRVMDQMEGLNLQSGNSAARTPEPPRLDVSRFSRLSLTSNGDQGNSDSAPQPQGDAAGH